MYKFVKQTQLMPNYLFAGTNLFRQNPSEWKAKAIEPLLVHRLFDEKNIGGHRPGFTQWQRAQFLPA